MADENHEDPTPGQEPGTGESETPNADGTPAGVETTETVELTPEQLRANLTRANEQAAAERIKRQEAIQDAADLRAKLADMKSVEEVDALVGDFQQKLSKSDETINRLLAAQAAGLPAGFDKRLDGSTYEELLADAQELAKSLAPAKTPPAPLPLGGGRDPKPEPEEKPGEGYRAAKDKHAY